jgi:hypothetical protein
VTFDIPIFDTDLLKEPDRTRLASTRRGIQHKLLEIRKHGRRAVAAVLARESFKRWMFGLGVVDALGTWNDLRGSLPPSVTG